MPSFVKKSDQFKRYEDAVVGAADKVKLDQRSVTDSLTGGTTASPYRHDTMRV